MLKTPFMSTTHLRIMNNVLETAAAVQALIKTLLIKGFLVLFFRRSPNICGPQDHPYTRKPAGS